MKKSEGLILIGTQCHRRHPKCVGIPFHAIIPIENFCNYRYVSSCRQWIIPILWPHVHQHIDHGHLQPKYRCYVIASLHPRPYYFSVWKRPSSRMCVCLLGVWTSVCVCVCTKVFDVPAKWASNSSIYYKNSMKKIRQSSSSSRTRNQKTDEILSFSLYFFFFLLLFWFLSYSATRTHSLNLHHFSEWKRMLSFFFLFFFISWIPFCTFYFIVFFIVYFFFTWKERQLFFLCSESIDWFEVKRIRSQTIYMFANVFE